MKILHLYLTLSIILLSAQKSISRPLPENSSQPISDGLEHASSSLQRTKNNILLKGTDQIIEAASEENNDEVQCEQIYGFLPCSKSIPGHVFLILVYEYLLFHGESYVASGGQRIFKILGPGVFGACAFQMIGALPESLILLASGLLNNKEVAQECIITGVGLLAGSSILLLTLVWGTCVVLASQNYSNYLQYSQPSSLSTCPDPTQQNPLERFILSLWPGYGVLTDSWSSYISRVMLFSIVPFVIILFPRFFHLSASWHRIFLVVALVVSVVFLLSYFFYQLFQPQIQKRQLMYLKNQNLATDIVKHMRRNTMGSLFTDDGSPNLSVIRRIFEEKDRNGDKSLDPDELNELFKELMSKSLNSDEDGANKDTILKEYNTEKDKKMTIDELVRVLRPSIENKREIVEERDISERSSSNMVDEGKFLTGLSKRRNSTNHASRHSTEEEDEEDNLNFEKKWEEADKFVEGKIVDKSIVAWLKALSLFALGILILGLLAEPLIHSVQTLSNAAKIPSFFVAFVFVPFATNARIAISAFGEAREKKANVVSLTFSEIYGTVLMNNLLGFSVLLSLIYFRGFNWNFSAEVLMVLMVCAVMGCIASFSRVFPLWISFLAFLLYPLSLVLVSVLGDFNWFE